MLDRLEHLATISVARGVGFAGLAIFCLMIGFLGSPVMALKAGGLGMLLVAMVLMLKARGAPGLAYRRTEVWLMLEAHERPPDAFAQRLITDARQKALLRFALATAVAAAVFLVGATLGPMAGLP